MNDKFQLGLTAVSVVVLFWAIQTLAAIPDRVDSMEDKVTRLETHAEDQDRRIADTENEVKDIASQLTAISVSSGKAADAAQYVKERWDRWETAELREVRKGIDGE